MTIPTLRKKTFNWGGLLTVSEVQSYHPDKEHGGMQKDMVLELRLLLLTGNRKSTDNHTEGSLNKRDLKAGPHSDTFSPKKKVTPYNSANPFRDHFLSNQYKL